MAQLCKRRLAVVLYAGRSLLCAATIVFTLCLVCTYLTEVIKPTVSITV